MWTIALYAHHIWWFIIIASINEYTNARNKIIKSSEEDIRDFTAVVI